MRCVHKALKVANTETYTQRKAAQLITNYRSTNDTCLRCLQILQAAFRFQIQIQIY